MIFFNQPRYELNKFGPSVTFEDFLSKEECSKLIAQMPNHRLEEAKIDVEGITNTSIRSTKVCALDLIPKNQWIFQKLEGAVCQANRETYAMDIVGLHEAVQLMQYDVGDFYSWHSDFSNKQYSRRKLSVSIQLTPSNEYEGGELEFFNNGTANREQGTMIVFPSYFYHQVREITKGQRRALIAWIDGPPLK